MSTWWLLLPWLVPLALLLAASAFFSGSEAALFYLSPRDLRYLQHGNAAQRTAARLMEAPQRLLAAVLFWNLMINVAYFAVTSVAGLYLQRQGNLAAATWLSLGAVLAIIALGEMLPKSLAVVWTRPMAAVVAVPLSAAVRVVEPVLPVLEAVAAAVQRVLFPRFRPEPYLEVQDLERAVTYSTSDAALLEQEERVLHNLLDLSRMRVEELMRPRNHVPVFHPPVSRRQLQGRFPRSGYVFVTEPNSDEIAAAVALQYLWDIPEHHLENYAEPVLYVPWCALVADALEQMRQKDRRVVVVVNEYGETIGVITHDDILQTVFAEDTSRTERLTGRAAIEPLGQGRYQVTGMTTLRRLRRFFGVDETPNTHSVTVGGLLQELLQRVPRVGDQARWGPFHFRVLQAPERGVPLVELTVDQTVEQASEEEP